jgi:hypothetical protein
MPKEIIARDLNGDALPYNDEQAKEEATKIFEEGKLVAVVSELDGHLSVQIMGPPSLKVYYILQDAARTYRKILQEKGLFQ